MKFIIVDDSKAFREGIKYYLENILKHKVVGMAENGVDFLAMNYSSTVDIILMDIEMPELNGMETVKKALWQNSFLRFIAITSYKDKVYLQELISAGFKSIIFKDQFYDEFENTILKVMNEKLSFPPGIKIR